MNNDLMNNIDVKRVLSPVSVADNTAQVGTVVDRQGYGSVTYLIATGSIADADATFTVPNRFPSASGNRIVAACQQHGDVVAGQIARRRQRTQRIGRNAASRAINERMDARAAALTCGDVGVGADYDHAGATIEVRPQLGGSRRDRGQHS